MKILSAILVSLFLCLTLFSGEWYDNYRTARADAVKQKKKLLIFFSGSDWCEPGRQLDRDLFKTSEFKRVADEKYVLYNADFPKYSRLGSEKEERNRQLAARYGISRFPAVIVVEPGGGGLLARQVGFQEITPKEFLKKLEATAATAGKSL